MAGSEPADIKIAVVGAGLAGLCCARTLQRSGFNAHIYEATDGVGGRVRTDIVDGFRLDRGFQALFTSYPAVRRELDLEKLQVRPFEPGPTVVWNGNFFPILNPFRKAKWAIRTALSGLFPLQDKVTLIKLRRMVCGLDLTDIFLLPDIATHEFLTEFGFSHTFLDNFIRPLFGGIFLQRNLDTSARLFCLVFKMMMEGDAVVPAGGMNAIPWQIVRDLDENTLHFRSPVTSLKRDETAVTGIVLADGTEVDADYVVIATPADIAAHLTGITLPQESRSVTCLYFEIPIPFTASKAVMVFADPNKYAGGNSLVNSATIITNTAPSYAPEGRHLLSVSVIGEPRIQDEQMVYRVRREIGAHFEGSDPEEWRLIRIYRIPWAQISQQAGIFSRLPSVETGICGLILSGEIVCHGSIQGALEAGRKSAIEVITAAGFRKRRRQRR